MQNEKGQSEVGSGKCSLRSPTPLAYGEVGSKKVGSEKSEVIQKSIMRRRLLDYLIGGAFLATLMSKATDSRADTGKNPQKRYAMVIDLRRCIGCHSCSVACKAENAVPLGVWRSWVKQIEKGRYPNVRKFFLPSLCNNCANPICIQNCPTKATWQRDDGIVMVDEHRCIGCKYCIASCPYDARHINPLKKIVQKCYWCYHRVDKGLEPACVNTCPVGARTFGDLNDANSEVFKLISTNPVQVIKQNMATFPQVYYIGADKDVIDPFVGTEHELSGGR